MQRYLRKQTSIALIDCKLVHMFIHCNLWLVYLLNADSLSVSLLYDWIVTTFRYEKLMFILIEITTYIKIWNYNSWKRTTNIYLIWNSSNCPEEISVAWPYPQTNRSSMFSCFIELKSTLRVFLASPTFDQISR